MDVSHLKDEDIIEKMLYFPKTRLDKIASCHGEERRLSFAAGLLLNEVLPKYNLTDKMVKYQKNGKPVLDSNTGLHISISHSGKISLLLVSTDECAVDIEEQKSTIESIVQSGFTEEEKFLYRISKEKREFFYQTWTRKECLMKVLNFKYLRDIDTLSPERYVGEEYSFLDYSSYFPGYFCSVLTKGVKDNGKKGKISWLNTFGLFDWSSTNMLGNYCNRSWN
ncbi:MAG: 4'-phosphopantetheinyl transferase superfamily protein [Lachnospiraceae bacterium]|nr:4'-phosphopantetheinyl transferase superfamily protein [Lachnospiraceae bacterium]